MHLSTTDLMQLALAQARLALAHDEVPIGAVIYHLPSQRIVGQAHNRRILDKDPTAHAEILAIRHAAKELGDWRLEETVLAVTLEPCPMCAGAIVNARIPKLVYGCADPKAGAVETLYQLCSDGRLNHRVQVEGGVMAEECAGLLTGFFAGKRAMGKK
jgi:tRNA(adenine34) deaminase